MSKKDKELIKVLEKEKSLLKITLEHYVKENSTLKQVIEDMKVTVKENKDQLNEYVTKITNRDLVVEKMKNTIEQLKIRLEKYEEKGKKYLKEDEECLNTDRDRIKENNIFSIGDYNNLKNSDGNILYNITNKNNNKKIEVKEENKLNYNNKYIKEQLQKFIDDIISYKKSLENQIEELQNRIILIEKDKNIEDYQKKINYNFSKDFFQSICENKLREILLIYNKNNNKVWELIERKDLFNINFNKILNENDYSKHNDIYSLKLFLDLKDNLNFKKEEISNYLYDSEDIKEENDVIIEKYDI